MSSHFFVGRDGARPSIADLRFVRPQLFFKLPFAIVQRLQPQLPAMQLDRELIDVAGDFSALRFVLGQLPSNFFRVSEHVCARLLQFRNGR